MTDALATVRYRVFHSTDDNAVLYGGTRLYVSKRRRSSTSSATTEPCGW